MAMFCGRGGVRRHAGMQSRGARGVRGMWACGRRSPAPYCATGPRTKEFSSSPGLSFTLYMLDGVRTSVPCERYSRFGMHRSRWTMRSSGEWKCVMGSRCSLGGGGCESRRNRRSYWISHASPSAPSSSSKPGLREQTRARAVRSSSSGTTTSWCVGGIPSRKR